MAVKIRRTYKGAAVSALLDTSGVSSATQTSIKLTTSPSDWPTGKFFVVVAPGTAQEEKMCVTMSGDTLTVVDPDVNSNAASPNGRGVDDTTARSAIDGGRSVYPVYTAIDADEANELTSTYSAQGHIVYQGASTFAGLAIGTAGQVLKVNSGATAPEWGQVSNGGIANNAVTTDKISDSNVTPSKLSFGVTGIVVPFAGTSAPTGWLLCYGQEVEISSYSSLYSVVGTTYGALTNGSGGAGSTHFRVPDLRGRVIAGQDDMGGTSANRLTGLSGGVDGDVLGATGGLESHTLTTAQMPSHQHTQVGHYHNLLMGGSIGNAGAGRELYGDWNADGSTTANVVPDKKTNAAAWSNPSYTTTVAPVINAEGGGGAHNNVQPTIILNYIIKT